MECIKDYCEEYEMPELMEKLRDFEYASNIQGFMYQLGQNDIDLYNDYGFECDLLQYSPQAEFFIVLLMKYVLPLFRKDAPQ